MALLVQRIFVSYSRKDYYFAESLAFHLLEADLPAWFDVKDLKPGADWEEQLGGALETASCFVLVLSRHALQSANVRAEWQRAVKLGKPIVVAQFGRAPLPDELRSARITNFRSGFGRGLRELRKQVQIAADGPSGGAAVGKPGILPGLPPWVAAMTVLMSIPLLGFCALAWYRSDLQTMGTPAALALEFGIILFLVWLLPLGFVRRRMGMTRLAVSLVCLAAFYAYQLVRVYLQGPPDLTGDTFGFLRFFRDHGILTMALCAIPLAGLAILMLMRPEDLLRWCPTGKVWNWYREAFARKNSAGIGDGFFSFRQVQDFYLISDAADRPAASRLRDELIRAGAREAAGSTAAATPVLLISNRTRRVWLTEQAGRLKDSVLTIVATGIALPESLGWLWRREWVDFRNWQITREGAQRLPNVPEAVTHVRLPRPVFFAHQLLCAFGGLLFVLGASVLPDKMPDTPTPQEAAAIVCSVLGCFCLFAGGRLVRRTITAEAFWRWVRAGAAAGILLGLLSLYSSIAISRTLVHIVVAVISLFAAPALLIRVRPQVAFWFPSANAPGKPDECLTPDRSWLTLLSFVLYLFLWTGILQEFKG